MITNCIYTVDPNHTTVGFSAKHMLVTTIRGRFTRWSGQVEVADDDLTSARVTGSIEAASVSGGMLAWTRAGYPTTMED